MAQTGHMLLYGWMTLCPLCPSPARDISALWQMVCPAWMPAAGSISCKYKNYCNTGLGGMPRRAKCGAQGSAVHFSGATALECCHHGWTHPGPTTNRGGLQQHPAWQHDNHHSGSHYHPSATPSLATTIEPPCDIFVAINHQLQRALEWLQWASPAISTPVSQHNMPKREPPSVAFMAPPPTEVTEDPLSPNEKNPSIPTPVASSTQVSPWVAMPEDIPSIAHISQSPSLLTVVKTLEVASIFPIP